MIAGYRSCFFSVINSHVCLFFSVKLTWIADIPVPSGGIPTSLEKQRPGTRFGP